MNTDAAPYVDKYKHARFIKIMFIIVCLVLTVIAFLFTLKIGFYKLSLSEVYKVIINHLSGNISNPRVDYIIWERRLPEAILAVFCGVSLAAGGAVMQTVLRNPLTDSYTTGISSGAFLGAVLSIILGFSIIPGIGSWAIVSNAFLFSLIPVGVIVLISRKKNVTSSKLILTGVAVMYLFSAITTLLMVSAHPEQLSDAYSWRIGTLANAEWASIPIVVPVTLVCLTFLMSQSKKYNVVSAGDNLALSLGVNSKKITIISLVVIAFMTASVVSFTGTIGFIGLVGPHIARIFVGSDCRYLIPASAAVGGLFLVCVDSVAKVSGTLGLPVGVISALIGAPIFIAILVKNKRTAWDRK